MARVVLVLQQHEFVGDQRLVDRSSGLSCLSVNSWSISCAGHDHLAPAGVELFEIDLLRFEILGDQAQRIALDAGVDVLGDEDDALALLAAA